MTAVRPPPYPADTKAKGWRFELDYEQIEQSDTWDLAPPEARPWLLMMWFAAWRQAPCGSLPADEEVLPAKFGMPAELWAKHRRVLLRGWWPADDGRLYHNTLVARVVEMLGRRRSDADRQALRRARQAEKKTAGAIPDTVGITDVSRVTQTGVQGESSTDHRLPNTNTLSSPPDVPHPPACAPAPACEGRPTPSEAAPSPPEAPPPSPPPPPPAPAATPQAQGTPYGAITRRLMAAGISRANPGNLLFRELVDAGVTADEFLAYRDRAIQAEDPFAYLLGTVRNERKRAKFQAAQLQLGAPTPQGRPPAPQSFRQQDEEAAMRRWEEATGRVHPDRQRPQDPRPVGPDVIDMESPALPALEHDDAA